MADVLTFDFVASQLSRIRSSMSTLQSSGYFVDLLGTELDYVCWHFDEGGAMEEDVLHSDGEDTLPVPTHTDHDNK